MDAAIRVPPPQAEREDAMQIDMRDRVLQPGERIGITAEARRDRLSIRRLSEHAYWIDVLGYHTTLVVGEESALLIDPLDGERTGQLIEIAASVFQRSISDVVYSHGHSDHIGGVGAILRQSTPVTIHASAACAQLVEQRGLFPAPTVVHRDREPFAFSGIDLQLVTVGGHTIDTTAVHLPDEGVLHAVDLIHPLQSEFPLFGGAVDIPSYEGALAQLAALDWRVMTAGHGDIAYPGDVAIVQEYLRDLRVETARAIDAVRADPPAASTVPNARVTALHTAIQNRAADALLRIWGQRLPGLEFAAASHVERMANELLYYSAVTP